MFDNEGVLEQNAVNIGERVCVNVVIVGALYRVSRSVTLIFSGTRYFPRTRGWREWVKHAYLEAGGEGIILLANGNIDREELMSYRSHNPIISQYIDCPITC